MKNLKLLLNSVKNLLQSKKLNIPKPPASRIITEDGLFSDFLYPKMPPVKPAKKENMNTNKTSEILTILQEELIEASIEFSVVAQTISKIFRFGYESYHPEDLKKVVNIEKLEIELGDVLAMIDLIVEENIGITYAGLGAARIRKNEKLKKYSTFIKKEKE